MSVLFGAGCFNLPSWETVLTVPILSEKFYARDMLDSALFRAGGDSVIEFHVEQGFDTVRLAEQFGEFSSEDSFCLAVDSFVLSPVLELRTGAGMEDIIGRLPADSVRSPMPAFEHEHEVRAEVPCIEDAELAAGFLLARVDNRMPVRLDEATLDIEGLACIDFGTIEPRGSSERRADLTGARLRAVLDGRLAVGSAGSGSESVWVRVSDSVLLWLKVDSVRLRRGRVRLADSTRLGAEYHRVSYLQTRHNVRLDSAFLKRGAVHFSINNAMPVPMRPRLSVREFAFDSTVEVNAGEEMRFTLVLDGRTYRNDSPDSSRLTITAWVDAEPSGATVELGPEHRLVVGYRVGDLDIGYLSGEALDTVWSPEFTGSATIEFPERMEHIKFANVRLTGTAVNGLGFQGMLEARVVAYNPQGESASISRLIHVGPGTPESPTTSSAEVDVASLFNIAPHELRFTGRTAVLGRGAASDASWASGHAEIQTPLRARLIADTFRFGPWTVPLDSAVRPGRNKQLNSAELVVCVSNHLPLSLTGKLSLKRGPGYVADVRLAIPEPEIEMHTGRVVAARDSTLTLSCTCRRPTR